MASSMGQRALRGALGFSMGTTPLPWPTNTPWPTMTDDLLPMVTLGCGDVRLAREPSAQMIASPPDKIPRQLSSQLTPSPVWCRIATSPPDAGGDKSGHQDRECKARTVMPPSAD
jgi:hypothetical protein